MHHDTQYRGQELCPITFSFEAEALATFVERLVSKAAVK